MNNSQKGKKKIRWNKDKINEKLNFDKRGIELIGDFKNVECKTTWKCLICLHMWDALPMNILFTKGKNQRKKGRGCPKCGRSQKLDNKEVDKRIKNLMIIRIGDYVNNHTKIDFKCTVDSCGYIWATSPSQVMEGISCPKCTNHFTNKISNQIIDNRIEYRNIIRIGEFKNSRNEIEWECKICNCKWFATPNSVVHRFSGCPNCCLSKNEKIILDILKNRNIKYISQFQIKNSNNNRVPFRVDFFLPDHNSIIEYNGAQHYKPISFKKSSTEETNAKFIKQQLRDEYIRKYCENNSIKLYEIDGRIYFYTKLVDFISILLDKIISE